ncbi:MAG: hypothetical protein QOE18_103 [Chloroflexota bacterium]|jgi:hypothetical protein|nr:hypothetical protein [Chloroflexota bacterium]
MPSLHRPRARLLALAGSLAAALLAACGGSTSPTSSTPSPLSQAQIQARYTSAAAQYNQSAVKIGLTVNAACDIGSPTAALSACQTALSQQRQAAIVYDNALRAIPFTGTAATDAAHLLSDDAAIESLLEQAATAPSLATVASVEHQVIPLLATAATAAKTLRADIGLPAPG